MNKFVNVLMEERKEQAEEKYVKPKYDWRYENNITNGKNKIKVDGEYSQWRTNNILANYPDTIFIANEMNINYHVTNQMHYDFLFGSIRKCKRWTKPESKEEKKVREREHALISLISSYYKYNNIRSKEASKILSEEQIEIIKEKTNKGEIK